jgi:hypothetical protein
MEAVLKRSTTPVNATMWLVRIERRGKIEAREVIEER